MPAKEQEILKILAQNEGSTVADIRDELNMDSNTFNVYSKRIRDKGIISSEGYGRLQFTLPRFGVFILSL